MEKIRKKGGQKEEAETLVDAIAAVGNNISIGDV